MFLPHSARGGWGQVGAQPKIPNGIFMGFLWDINGIFVEF